MSSSTNKDDVSTYKGKFWTLIDGLNMMCYFSRFYTSLIEFDIFIYVASSGSYSLLQQLPALAIVECFTFLIAVVAIILTLSGSFT